MKERIKGAFTKKKIFHVLKMALFVVALSLILLSLLGTVAHATGLVDDTINTENLYSKYPLSNYQLDFYVDNSWSWLPWNWLDGIGKSVQYGLYCITNFVWTISLYLSNATGYVVQEAYKLDFINDMADSIGKSIQTLAGVTANGFSSSGFYVGFLLLIILVVGLYVAYTGLIKRETSKALHAVINFVVVFVLSASFIAYAPDYIKKINEFSSDISTASLDLGTKIMLPNSDSEGKDSVDLIRDSLFSIQVEQPWLLLQFGNSNAEEIGTDRVEALVSASPEDEDGKTREEVVKTEIEDNDNNNLTIPQVVNRLGMVFFLLFFNLGISSVAWCRNRSPDRRDDWKSRNSIDKISLTSVWSFKKHKKLGRHSERLTDQRQRELPVPMSDQPQLQPFQSVFNCSAGIGRAGTKGNE